MQTQLTKQEVIEEMTRRLVEYYHPVRIYLFGSEARAKRARTAIWTSWL
jgi:predicted nucleotidyltransferase